MEQAFNLDQLRRVRSFDPETSHQAAAKASRFAGSHSRLILTALRGLGTATAAEISAETDLSVEQCCRRLTELRRKQLIDVLAVDGKEVHRDGYRVWQLA